MSAEFDQQVAGIGAMQQEPAALEVVATSPAAPPVAGRDRTRCRRPHPAARRRWRDRIEIAAARLVPMKISRRIYSGRNSWGRPSAPDNIFAQGGERVREIPVTVARERGQWHQLGLPPGPLDARFAVFTSGPAAAARALSPQAAEHLLAQVNSSPFPLHFEAGSVFGTVPRRIDPDHVLEKVDVILGLLDRMGVAPAQPPGTA